MSLFNELRQHPAIYTMESSFCGNDVGPFARYHFSTDNLMQTGTDFCRSLLIYNQIPAPFSILEGLLKNINGIFSHYKVINDKLQFVDKDHDVELMKLYHERLEQMHTNNIPINTKQIRKALLNVLR
jgi:aminopeptidase-like protein